MAAVGLAATPTTPAVLVAAAATVAAVAAAVAQAPGAVDNLVVAVVAARSDLVAVVVAASKVEPSSGLVHKVAAMQRQPVRMELQPGVAAVVAARRPAEAETGALALLVSLQDAAETEARATAQVEGQEPEA